MGLGFIIGPPYVPSNDTRPGAGGFEAGAVKRQGQGSRFKVFSASLNHVCSVQPNIEPYPRIIHLAKTVSLMMGQYLSSQPNRIACLLVAVHRKAENDRSAQKMFAVGLAACRDIQH